MPYTIKKVSNTYMIMRSDTGKVVGHSDTMAKAQASMRIRMEAETKKKSK